MKKETLTFPDYESMWSFKQKTQAINVRITPREKIISGLFDPQEIDMAVKDFQAIKTPYAAAGEQANTANSNRTTTPKFKFKTVSFNLFLTLKTFIHSFLA